MIYLIQKFSSLPSNLRNFSTCAIQFNQPFFQFFYSSLIHRRFLSTAYSPESPPKVSYCFTFNRIGTGSNRKSLITFNNCLNNKIIHYEIISGNNFHKRVNIFINKVLTRIVDTSPEFQPTQLNIFIPINLANKQLVKNVLERFNIKLINYKQTDLSLPPIFYLIKGEFHEKKDVKWSIARIKKSINKYLNKYTIDESVLEFDLAVNPNSNIENTLKISNQFHDKTNLLNYTPSNISSKGLLLAARAFSTFKQFINDKSYLSFVSRGAEHDINETMLEKSFNEFWDLYLSPIFAINKNAKVATQFRAYMGFEGVRSFSAIDIICAKDKLKLFNIYRKIFTFRCSHYKVKDIKWFVFGYRILDENTPTKYPSDSDNFKKAQIKLKKEGLINSVPKTMNTRKWGPSVKISGETYISINNTLFAQIQKDGRSNKVRVYVRSLGSVTLLSVFTDHLGKDGRDLTTFTREIKDNVIHYVKGFQSYITKPVENIKFIPKALKPSKPNNKVITMDFETKEIVNNNTMKNYDRKMEVVCASLYDKVSGKPLNFNIWDYSSTHDLVESLIKALLVKKYSGYSVYLHNFGAFDSVFLMDHLAGMKDIKLNLIRRDDIIIKVNIQYNKYVINGKTVYKSNINIFDSFNILPISLEKLGKCFGSELKSMFPLKILNDPNISLNYEGDVPDFKYFYQPSYLNPISYNAFYNKYLDYKKSFEKDGVKWNLKKELVKYCEQDVITLHNVILEFTHLNYEKFGVNILKLPTLASMAFMLFRYKFMSSKLIPIITGDVYKDIKEAYYGGFVDVFRPFAKFIKSFDVNSLYPFSMLSNPMPVGIPEVFEGIDENKIENLFGFVYAKIEAPLNLNSPILPFKINGVTIYPTGTFEGWYFTEELKNAAKYGYKYKIISGYKFKKGYLFSSYVNSLYKIKSSVTPDNPWYTISKLLLNSLYGRFGMNPILPQNIILNSKEEVDKIVSDCKTFSVEKCGDKYWVTYIKDETVLSSTYASIPVAAAIASYARIHMTQFIMKYSYEICTIDTDGIKLTCDLNSKDVGPELGMMKREYEFKEGCFIAPKVYGGITTDDKMIVKAKGVKSPLSYWKMKSLLMGDPIKIEQQKWYREYGESTIYVRDELYTLIPTDNKRHLIHDSFGMLVGTKPFELLNGVIIKREREILYYLPSPVTYLAFPLFTHNPIDYFNFPDFHVGAPSAYPHLPLTGTLAILELAQASVICIPIPSSPSVIYLPHPMTTKLLASPFLVSLNMRICAPIKILYLAEPTSIIYLPARQLTISLPPYLPSDVIYLPDPWLTKLLPQPLLVSVNLRIVAPIKRLSLPSPISVTPPIIYIEPSLPKVLYIKPSLNSPQGIIGTYHSNSIFPSNINKVVPNNKPLSLLIFLLTPVERPPRTRAWGQYINILGARPGADPQLWLSVPGISILKKLNYVISGFISMILSFYLIMSVGSLLVRTPKIELEYNLNTDIVYISNHPELVVQDFLTSGVLIDSNTENIEVIKDIWITNDDIKYMVGITIAYFILTFVIIYFIGGSSADTPSHNPGGIDTSNILQLPNLPEMDGPFSPASLDLFEMAIRERAITENEVIGVVEAATHLINI